MRIATVTQAPQLRLASFDDYEQIARLEAANGLTSLPPDDWRHLWLNNPLWDRLGQRWPIGWVMEDARGRIVGSLANIPSLYTFQGRELLCANGRGWVVAPEFRGLGLWLMSEYFGQTGADLFINTTVGTLAEPMIASLSDRIPVGDLQSIAFRPIAYRSLAEKGLRQMQIPLAGLLSYPAAAALRVRDEWKLRSFPSAPNGVTIESTASFDARFDGFWHELAAQNRDTLLGVRDARALNWHFAIPLRLGYLWILTASRHGLLRAYMIVKRHELAQRMRRMRVIDFQTLDPQGDLLPGLLRAALARCAAEGHDVLEHVGCGLPRMRDFDRFAPYRRQLPCWPFYYRAVDPALHSQLAQPEFWSPSTFDGDASFE